MWAQPRPKNTTISAGDSTASLYEVSDSSGGVSSFPENDYLPAWYDMITRIPGDWIEFSRETFRTENIPLIIGLTVSTTGLVITDRQWWQTEQKWYDESPTFHRVTDWLVFTGDGRFQFGLVGAFAAYGFVFGDIRSLRTASETTEAILACGGVVQLLKHVTGRESPDVSSKRTGAWRFFPNQIDYLKHTPHYDAFPSGHIATATTTLIVIAENYPELTWLKPVGYVVLAGISSSLVAYGIHWWSDIPLGVALGYSFGEIAAHPLRLQLGKNRQKENTTLTFSPTIVGGGLGVSMLYRF